jgi:hypothetical protein
MDYYEAQADKAPFPYGWVFLSIFGQCTDKKTGWRFGNVRADLLLNIWIKSGAVFE